MNNQATQVQFGGRKPVVTGTQRGGRSFNTLQMQDHGLLISVTPRFSEGAPVLMDFRFELSRLEAKPAGDDAAPTRTPDTSTVTIQTSLGVADGKTVVAGSLTTKSAEGEHDFVVLVRARVNRGE